MDSVIQILVNRFKARKSVNVPFNLERNFFDACSGIGITPNGGSIIHNEQGHAIGRVFYM